MDLPALHADRLRAFVAVARAGGFSKGARALGQTQSSTSQAVLALERELGEALFVRDGRTIHLTDAGRILLEHATRVFDELARAQEALLARRALTAGQLQLGTSDTLATYVLPPVFARFRALHPAVELRLDNRPSPAIAERVAARAVDLGVVSLPLPSTLRIEGRPALDVLRVRPLVPQRDVLVCPAGHAFAKRASVSIEELAREPLVLLDRSTATRALLDERFDDAGVRPRVAMEMSSVEVLKRLVELGFGLSVVPELAARRELDQCSLVAVRVRGLGRPRHVGLITATVGTPSHAARAFIEVLERELRTA